MIIWSRIFIFRNKIINAGTSTCSHSQRNFVKKVNLNCTMHYVNSTVLCIVVVFIKGYQQCDMVQHVFKDQVIFGLFLCCKIYVQNTSQINQVLY